MSDDGFSVTGSRGPSLDVVNRPALTRVRLDVSYEGTDFSGWALQPGLRTVQRVLQDALAMVLRLPPVTLTVAGRTDAGVHAVGQVAHLNLPTDVWLEGHERLVRRLGGVLPGDVRVLRAVEVPAAFEARFAALWRRYEYRICDRDGGVDPLRRRFVLSCSRRLDVEAMSKAAKQLLGLHDFVAFCKRREHATTIRTLQSFDILREQDEILCTVQADAFCHSMVRSLVGSLLAVGAGRRPLDWPMTLLERDSRADDIVVAPAHGLTLVAVGYPPDGELAERAELARAKRRP